MAEPYAEAERPPAQIPGAETPGVAALLTLAVGVVVIAGLFFAREVLIPITLAVVLSFLLGPLVGLLSRMHLGRVPSVLLSVVAALALIAALGTLIGTQVAELAGEAPQYQTTVEHKIDQLRTMTVGRLSGVVDTLGQQGAKTSMATPTASQPAAAHPSAPTPDAKSPPMLPALGSSLPAPLDLLRRIVGPVVSPLSTMAIVLIFSIFILLQREDLRDRLIRLFGSGDLHRTTGALDDAARRLGKYFIAQLGVNTAFGVVIGTGLFVIGVPSPLLWGILGMLLRFVPYIGAPMSAVLPLALAAAVDPGWSMIAWTAALYVCVEGITGQVVEPMLYAHSTGLSPFSVVVAATFWTWLWGPIGLLLSTPLTLCLVVLGRHNKRLEFLDVMLGDRPALSPVDSFYQRMLAGDPDEALDQAEILLKERSLSSYYDEVALKGLQLAANDSLRGVLSSTQLERVKNSIKSLVHDLAAHEDVMPASAQADDGAVALPPQERELPRKPPPAEHQTSDTLPPVWYSDRAVLCVAGRGPLDEAASSMLSQLLRKHGLKGQTMSYDALSRDAIDSLDAEGIAMVCVSYLEITGSPAHLRYLLRRLRAKLPSAPLLIGLWPAGEAALNDERLRQALGADYFTSSLREAIEACLAARDVANAPPAASLQSVARH